VRIIAWNIRAGGGVRSGRIAAQLKQWAPDIVLLLEFRGTPPSQSIAQQLASMGLTHQRTTVDIQHPAINAVLIASRWPLRILPSRQNTNNPHRWLPVNVASPQPIAILGLHCPNRATGTKTEFMNSVFDTVQKWRGLPAILLGDTNSGRINIDEESPTFNRFEDEWLLRLSNLQWQDAFRLLHGQLREFTWYSPGRNNGFRLDQMFLHPSLASHARKFSHKWGNPPGTRKDVLSDHAAQLLDLDSDFDQ